jgi:hypothetical protein
MSQQLASTVLQDRCSNTACDHSYTDASCAHDELAARVLYYCHFLADQCSQYAMRPYSIILILLICMLCATYRNDTCTVHIVPPGWHALFMQRQQACTVSGWLEALGAARSLLFPEKQRRSHNALYAALVCHS